MKAPDVDRLDGVQANVVLTSIEPTFSTRILCWVRLQNASCKRDKADGASSSFQRSAIAEHATVSAKGIHLSIQNLWKACSCSAYLSELLAKMTGRKGVGMKLGDRQGTGARCSMKSRVAKAAPSARPGITSLLKALHQKTPKKLLETPANTLKGPKQPERSCDNAIGG